MLLSKELLVAAVLAVARPATATIWPIPQNITTGNTTLLISPDIVVTYNDASICLVVTGDNATAFSPMCQCLNPNLVFSLKQLVYTYGYEPNDVQCSQQIVSGGVSRALSNIFYSGLVPWKLRPKNSLSKLEPNLYAVEYGYGTQNSSMVRKLVITQTAEDTANRTGLDESYKLTVSVAGEAELTAVSSIGVLRGLESFSQLFYAHTSGNAWYTPYAPVAIDDRPKYEHRGVLLDVSRMWFDVKHLYRTIDAVAWNKMNRLHLHITDSQSWPLDIPSMPEIAREGAYRTDLVYTAEDLDALQRYAVARGVDLIVEIDMPGHIGSLALSHPELIMAYDAFPYFWWCAEPPCGAFKLNNTAVDDFLQKLFDDLMPRIAPYTSYFHTGGDELKANDSLLDPDLGTNAPEVLQPLLQRFISANHDRVRAYNITPLVWEEIPLDWNVTLGSDVIVQSWLGTASVQKLATAGQRVIDSNYNYWYLDCGRGQWVSWDNGAAFSAGFPFNDWCGPAKSWQLVYSYDPIRSSNLTGDAASKILGGEVAVWSETIDATNLDNLLWPRGSAAAEVLWSGNTDASGQNRSQLTVTPRLNEWRERLVGRGVNAAPIQMIWCTQADNSTECSQPTGPGY